MEEESKMLPLQKTQTSGLLLLPPIYHSYILTYLPSTTVILVLPKVCSFYYHLIKDSQQQHTSALNSLIGAFPTTANFIKDSTIETMRCIIHLLTSQSKEDENDSIEIPYYGFKTDGGCDENYPIFLFDKLFRNPPPNLHSAVCFREGKNFHVEGCLSLDYYTSDSEFLKSSFYTQSKEFLPPETLKDYCNYLQYGRFNIPSLFHKMAFENPMEIELPFYNLKYVIPLINRVSISRRGNFTCPVKALALFVADEYITFDNELLKMFHDVSNAEAIGSLVKNAGDKLPAIEETNIDSLQKNYKSMKSVKEGEMKGPEYVIFSNKGVRDKEFEKKLGQLKPIAWINFWDDYDREMELVMPRENWFTGKFVIAKFISCSDMRSDIGWIHEGTNIDVKHIHFKGILLHV